MNPPSPFYFYARFSRHANSRQLGARWTIHASCLMIQTPILDTVKNSLRACNLIPEAPNVLSKVGEPDWRFAAHGSPQPCRSHANSIQTQTFEFAYLEKYKILLNPIDRKISHLETRLQTYLKTNSQWRKK